MPTPTAHPINPETKRLFEEQFGEGNVYVDTKASNLLQFIADREHEAVEKFKSVVHVEDYEWDGGKEAWNDYLKSLTDKESA